VQAVTGCCVTQPSLCPGTLTTVAAALEPVHVVRASWEDNG